MPDRRSREMTGVSKCVRASCHPVKNLGSRRQERALIAEGDFQVEITLFLI